jgi:hypothetical protein
MTYPSTHIREEKNKKREEKNKKREEKNKKKKETYSTHP